MISGGKRGRLKDDGVHPKRLHRNHQVAVRSLNVTMPAGGARVLGWPARVPRRPALRSTNRSRRGGLSGHRGKLNPHDTNAEALAVAADWRGRSVGDPVRLRPEFLYRFRPYAVLPARDGLRTRLRLARRHPADARPGAAASGFPARLHTRARPYFVHSRWAPPPSAVCSDRPASGSTPGSSRSRRGWCCGSCGGAPAVWRRWAAASKARQGFRDIGPDPCNNALLVELRPILHIHLDPQISKRLHLRFHLGRADHPESVK